MLSAYLPDPTDKDMRAYGRADDPQHDKQSAIPDRARNGENHERESRECAGAKEDERLYLHGDLHSAEARNQDHISLILVHASSSARPRIAISQIDLRKP